MNSVRHVLPRLSAVLNRFRGRSSAGRRERSPVGLAACALLAAAGLFSVVASAASDQTLFTTQTPTSTTYAGLFGQELGVKFIASRPGKVTALRFYKPSGETSGHSLSLWNAYGGLLARQQTVAETTSGWQEVKLSTPVAISPNTTYVVSANANFYYAQTNGGLRTQVVNGTLASVADGLNGVYALLPGLFPSATTFTSPNYFHDVRFAPDPTLSQSGGDGQTGIVGTPLAQPLTIQATNFDGTPASGTTIALSVSGPATLAASTVTTNASGIASVSLTPSGVGSIAVTATSASSSVAFSALATGASAITTTPSSVTFNATSGGSNPAAVPVAIGGGAWCAAENGTCTFSGTQVVSYGAAGKFNTKTATGSIACNNATFSDPNVGVVKACYVGGSGTVGQVCANENGTCTFNGTQIVSFGAAGKFTAKSATGSIACNDATFGDPNVGVVKACYVGLVAAPTISASSDSSWLAASVPGIPPSTSQISATIAGLAAGTYSGKVTYTPQLGSPVTVTAQTTIAVTLAATPTTLSFTGTAGGSAPPSATVQIAASGNAAAAFSARTDQSWLTVTPATGASPSTLTVSAATSGLAAGTYSANVIVTPTGPTGGAAVTIPVTLTLNQLVGRSLFSSLNPTAFGQDGTAYELGLKFQTARTGQITAIRYFNPTNSPDSGTHTGRLWSIVGGTPTVIASVVFANETSSGWQRQALAAPVAIKANTTYVVTVNANVTYAFIAGGLATAVVNNDIASVADGANGIFTTTLGAFPTQSVQGGNTNYMRDVEFVGDPVGYLVKTGGDAQFGGAGNALATPFGVVLKDKNDVPVANAPVTFAVTAGGGSVTPAVANTNAAGQATSVLTLGATPAANTVSVSAASAPSSVVFSATGLPVIAGERLFGTATPTVTANDQNDGASYELGMRFTVSRPGKIAGVRFWKGNLETGTHTGRLWSSNGTLLASAQFAIETPSGWQEQAFAQPVQVVPGTTYVISVNAVTTYPYLSGGLASAVVNGDLSSVSGGANGVLNYAAGTFPKNAFGNLNYFRDVIFQPDAGGVTIASGDHQFASPGTTLTTPLVAQVLDANGNPQSGVTVQFAVTVGGGSLSVPSAVTDANGQASTVLTLGAAAGRNVVTATASAVSTNFAQSATFTETANNAIVAENLKPGATDWSTINSNLVTSAAPEIVGYASAPSANLGGTLDFKIALRTAGTYSIDVYRLGWYGGVGARKVLSTGTLSGTTQPACATTDTTTLLIECNWSTSYTLSLASSDWTTGIYIAKLIDGTSGKSSQIWFVVRDDSSHSDVLYQSAFSTYLAYNNFGSKSLYDFNSAGGIAAFKVSLDRPFSQTSVDQGSLNNILFHEYDMVRWLESQGYDVSYTTGIDLEIDATQLQNGAHKMWMNAGHDEYWSLNQRNAVEAARDAGMHLGFFSGNSVYWKVRYEPSSSGQPNRVMVCYKCLTGDATCTPDPVTPTTTWRDAAVGRPENSLMGVMYVGDNGALYGGADFRAANPADPYWANTGVSAGETLGPLVGFEWDAVVSNGATPANLVTLSTAAPVDSDIEGETVQLPPGQSLNVANAARYTAASGAKVFAAGSIQWMWGLDSDRVTNPRASTAARQMFVNVLSDMGVRPATPNAGLIVP